MIQLPSVPAWSTNAACSGLGRQVDLFFPEKGVGCRAALEICAGCAVRVECGEYALEHRIRHGVWGGMTGRERQRIARERARGGSSPRHVGRRSDA